MKHRISKCVTCNRSIFELYISGWQHLVVDLDIDHQAIPTQEIVDGLPE